MAERRGETSPSAKIPRIAGLLLLASLIVPALNWALVLSRFAAARGAVEAARDLAANDLLFRAGIAGELVTSAVAVGLALALYVVTRSVDEDLALLGLLFKVVEAVLWTAIALGHVAALLIARRGASPGASDAEGLQAVGALLLGQVALNAVPGVFLGSASMVFLALLGRSRLVPRVLAGFGVLSYALVLASNLLAIASPAFATVASQAAWGAPSVLAELAIGSWLLVARVTIPARHGPA